MTTREIRGYAVALTLLGFAGAWAATTHETPQPASTAASTAPATQDPRLTALAERRQALVKRSAEVNQIIARRRAAAANPAPVQVVTVPAASASAPAASTATRSS